MLPVDPPDLKYLNLRRLTKQLNCLGIQLELFEKLLQFVF